MYGVTPIGQFIVLKIHGQMAQVECPSSPERFKRSSLTAYTRWKVECDDVSIDADVDDKEISLTVDVVRNGSSCSTDGKDSKWKTLCVVL